MSENNILIAGATGFIGRNLARKCIDSGYNVRAFVRNEKEARKTLPENLDFFVGDLTEPETMLGIEENIDYVCNCAGALGKWGTTESELDLVNVNGTENLLKCFAKKKIKRFIQLSAGGVTGPLRKEPADETYECRPATAYERSKLKSEQIALRISQELEVPLSVVRPTFTYGPGDQHKLSLFRAVSRRRFAFIGDGHSVNHPVYIDDLIKGLTLAMNKAENGEIYIIGGPRPVTKIELINTIANAIDTPPPKVHIPRFFANFAAFGAELLGKAFGFEPIITESRVMMMGDNYGYSIEKAKSELGFSPNFDLDTGIKNTVEDYRLNKCL